MFAANEQGEGSSGLRLGWIAAASLSVFVYFVAASAAFAGSASLVKDINTSFAGASSTPTALANAGGKLYFAADNGVRGVEPWVSDGTPGGTHMLRDIYSSPTAVGSSPNGFTFVHTTGGDEVFFEAQDQTHGTELWKTDGTAPGTKLVKDIWPGSSSGSPMDITAVPERHIVVFIAFDPTHGYELWKSNGTAAGTTMIRDIDPGNANGLNPTAAEKPVDVGGEVYFEAFESIHGSELWKTDGTSAGTKIVKNIAPGAENSEPKNFIDLNGTLLFMANDNTHGDELWRSDGTAAGTTMVKDINPGFYDGGFSEPTKVGNKVFFGASDSGMAAGHGGELYRTNGNPGGTFRVADINPGPGNSSPDQLAAVNGELFFTANNATDGSELWKSNGTSAGTIEVKNIDGTSGSSYPTDIVNAGGIAVFTASESTEPWESNGTDPGTMKIANIAPGNQSSVPQGETVVNGKVFFSASDGSTGDELWEATP
jgi:ELWxxDGT repeat protein